MALWKFLARPCFLSSFQPSNLVQVRTGIAHVPRHLPKIERSQGRPSNKTLDVVLLQDIEDLGQKGDVVNVCKRRMRFMLYPLKQAVYAVDENVEKYAKKPEYTETREFQEGIKEMKANIEAYNALNGTRLIFERDLQDGSLVSLAKPLTKRDVAVMISSMYGLDDILDHDASNMVLKARVLPEPPKSPLELDKPQNVLKKLEVRKMERLMKLQQKTAKIDWDQPFLDRMGWFEVIVKNPSNLVVNLNLVVDIRPTGSSKSRQNPLVIFNYTRNYRHLLKHFAGIEI